jgi:hypothetical protein
MSIHDEQKIEKIYTVEMCRNWQTIRRNRSSLRMFFLSGLIFTNL